jgi:hypothetical protein
MQPVRLVVTRRRASSRRCSRHDRDPRQIGEDCPIRRQIPDRLPLILEELRHSIRHPDADRARGESKMFRMVGAWLRPTYLTGHDPSASPPRMSQRRPILRIHRWSRHHAQDRCDSSVWRRSPGAVDRAPYRVGSGEFDVVGRRSAGGFQPAFVIPPILPIVGAGWQRAVGKYVAIRVDGQFLIGPFEGAIAVPRISGGCLFRFVIQSRLSR